MLGVSSESLPQLRLLSRAAGVSGDGLAALPAYSSLDKIAFIHIQVTLQ